MRLSPHPARAGPSGLITQGPTIRSTENESSAGPLTAAMAAASSLSIGWGVVVIVVVGVHLTMSAPFRAGSRGSVELLLCQGVAAICGLLSSISCRWPSTVERYGFAWWEGGGGSGGRLADRSELLVSGSSTTLLRGGQGVTEAGYPRRPRGGRGHRVPVSRCVSAAGVGFLVILFPPRDWAFLAVGLPVRPGTDWTSTPR